MMDFIFIPVMEFYGSKISSCAKGHFVPVLFLWDKISFFYACGFKACYAQKYTQPGVLKVCFAISLSRGMVAQYTKI